MSSEVYGENECSICFQTKELKWTLSCGHSFCYLCLKGSIESNDAGCPICRADIPSDIYENAKMADMDTEIPMEDVNYRWLYSGRNTGWWAYTDSHNRIIEDAYNSFLQDSTSTADINIYGKIYTINFSHMTQKSPHGDWRNVKRLGSVEDLDNFDEKSLKGIAGIQVDHQ